MLCAAVECESSGTSRGLFRFALAANYKKCDPMILNTFTGNRSDRKLAKPQAVPTVRLPLASVAATEEEARMILES